MSLSPRGALCYRNGMDDNEIAPATLKELRAEVRDYILEHPEASDKLRVMARVEGTPDLFGWIRLWLAMEMLKGVHEMYIIALLSVSEWSEDDEE